MSTILSIFFESFDTLIPYDIVGYAAIESDVVRAVWRRSKAPVNTKIHEGFHLPLRGTSLLDLAKTKIPRVINDTEAYLAQHSGSVSTKLVVAEGVKSSLTCPIVIRDETVGFLFFSSFAVDTYRDIDPISVLGMARILEVVITEQTARLYAEAQRQEQTEAANHDPLTGLLNRRGLDLVLAAIPAAHQHCSLIYVDVDEMKLINDTYGHEAGDEVLQQVATDLRSCVRERDFVARIGGDEFVIVLPGLNSRPRLEQICREILETRPRDIAGSLSLGAVYSTVVALDIHELVIRADQAMYASKERGGNCLTVSPPTDHS